jgi:dynein regulatory complex subunit 2
MRLAKAESLKKDVEILSQNHERDVDRKDAILQMLDRDLEEAEDQFQMALRTHLSNIDILISLHDTRLYSLEKNFYYELNIMQKDFHTEKEKMLLKFKLEKKELVAVIETIEHDENERDGESKHSFEQLREEIRNRNLEEINMLRISLDAQIEELEQHFETAHLNYLQQTAQRTHDFKELTQNDQRLSREIELKKRKIDNLQTMIQQWKAKIRQLNRETEERNRLLLEEKHAIQRHYQQLKQRISAYRLVIHSLTLVESVSQSMRLLT